MNVLFTYLFDEEVLKKLREKWIELYDFNFIDNKRNNRKNVHKTSFLWCTKIY